MKLLFSIILSTIIFGASFQNSLFMIDYQINRNFYEIHCINKAKPDLDCHGKCQMKKESEKSSNPFALVKYSFEFNILPTKTIEFLFKKNESFAFNEDNFKYLDLNFSEVSVAVLPHPPQI